MSLLDQIHGPEDLKRLRRDQLPALAQEVRDRLIERCSVTGGHIDASLGVVELAIALLYEFDSPRDKVLWDVGHQAYAWKLLTGRGDRFHTLRTEGGISGFLKRDESPHDQFGAGHAGTAMTAALGMATARVFSMCEKSPSFGASTRSTPSTLRDLKTDNTCCSRST